MTGARIATVVAMALVAALLVAGCGEDSEVSAPGEPEAPPGFAQAPNPEAMQAFQDCLEDQGVEAPEPQFAPGGPGSGPGEAEAPEPPSDEELEAFEACRDELPEGDQVVPPPSG